MPATAYKGPFPNFSHRTMEQVLSGRGLRDEAEQVSFEDGLRAGSAMLLAALRQAREAR